MESDVANDPERVVWVVPLMKIDLVGSEDYVGAVRGCFRVTGRSRQPYWPEYLYLDAAGYFAVDPEDTAVDEEMFDDCASAVGRNDAPALLFDLHARRVLDLVARDWTDDLLATLAHLADIAVEEIRMHVHNVSPPVDATGPTPT